MPELLVLKLLSRREMYGYEIVKAIQAETGETLAFGEGCIYPCLHYLEEENSGQQPHARMCGGRSRNYYALTRGGSKRLEELSADWSRVTSGISLLIQGEHA